MNLQYKDLIIDNSYGEIRFRIYEDNVMVLMGAYVIKRYRGKGMFKFLFEELLLQNQNISEIQICLANKHLLNYMLSKDFVITKEPIRHWNTVNNGVNIILRKNIK